MTTDEAIKGMVFVGQCPVQGDCDLPDGRVLYFRARWTVSVNIFRNREEFDRFENGDNWAELGTDKFVTYETSEYAHGNGDRHYGYITHATARRFARVLLARLEMQTTSYGGER